VFHTARAVYATGADAERASPTAAGVFFERRYSSESLDARLLGLGWQEEAREYARERRPVHELFFRARPWSFLAGGLLPLLCVRNFAPISDPSELRADEHGVVYLRLRRPK
jgi:hypothetical protein